MPVRSAALLACLMLPPMFAHAAVAPVPAPSPETARVEPAAPAPRVLLVTTQGEITIELDAAAAPRTVENFLAYARDGHYNGTIFHRVVPGLLVQGGAFTPDLQQKPNRAPVPNEADNGLSNRRGTVAAARDRGVSDSATTQFFINLADNSHFDRQDGDSPYTAGYAVFGRVLQGLDVLDRIAALPTSARGPFPGWVPNTPVLVERVQVLASSAPVAPVDVEPTTP